MKLTKITPPGKRALESIMKKNIGKNDRILRLCIGIVLLVIAFFMTGWGATIIALGGLFCLFEAATSWCALYQILGKNSCKR